MQENENLSLLVGETAGRDDFLLPFQADGLDVRGRLLKLGPEINTLLKRHAYPRAVSKAVAEAVTLTVLLGSALKLEGRFQLQTKSDGPISMLVVDFDAPNKMRAYAQFEADGLTEEATTASLLGKGHLALTIDQGGDMSRYQGVVPLDGHGLEAAAHQYFRQSEQIPTRIRLAVGEIAVPGGAEWRAGGLFLQFLPEAPERMRLGDLPPGDAPEGAVLAESGEDDLWTEAKLLADTVEDHELLDPTLSSESLLYRLFHERGVRVFAGQAVVEACRCSRDRILMMLRRFSDQERLDMRGDDGRISITCEFCSTHYAVTPEEAAPQ
ncbi:MAG: Hsp33 family molecular chaperone [Beijerinckiaceae bacterium]